MSKKNQNYTNRKQNRFQPERMRGNVFVNNSGKQWLPGENGRAAKVERLLRGAKEEKKEIAGNMAGYKNSGVEWIGAIPKEWKVMPLKYITKCKDSQRIPIDVAKREHGRFPYWGAGGITDYVNSYIFDEELILLGEDAAPFIDKKRDVAFLVNDKVWVNNHIHVLKANKDSNASYIRHCLNITQYNEFIMGSVIPKLTQTDMKKIPIICPPLPEQQRIADFLDTKCGILDRTIDAVSRQIEDLEKYKKALITKTVTKGICKKGEPERAMKDSGVEWIGEDIPFDWDINRLQFCIDEISERNYAGKETHILSLMKDKGVIPYEEKGRVGNISKTDVTQYKLAYPNTLITNSMNIIIGSSGISQYKGCVSPAYYVFKAKPNNDIRYFNYIFAVRAFQNECRRFANGILEIRLRISSTNLLKIKVPVPSPEEQQQIADYLDEKCKNIDNRVQKRKQQLEWLKEYKKSLIFDYVTGKKRIEE